MYVVCWQQGTYYLHNILSFGPLSFNKTKAQQRGIQNKICNDKTGN